MNDQDRKVSVAVRIAGEEHTIRANAEPDYTRSCARYVDERISDIRGKGMVIETHKAAILAALSITDERLTGDLYLLKAPPGKTLPGLGLAFTGRFAARLTGETARGEGDRPHRRLSANTSPLSSDHEDAKIAATPSGTAIAIDRSATPGVMRTKTSAVS